ncbi:MAG: helix-turn-helix domain-containing protein [Bdellovibrionales bacterium]
MKQNRNVEITGEVKTLRYMRIQAGLSMRQAGRLLGITDTAISHLENGKMKLPLARIEQMVVAYGETMDNFFRTSRAKTLPCTTREECERLLRRIPIAKLRLAYEALKNLTILTPE